MLAIFDIIQGIISNIMTTAGLGATSETVIPQEIINAVEKRRILGIYPIMGRYTIRRHIYYDPIFYYDPYCLWAIL